MDIEYLKKKAKIKLLREEMNNLIILSNEINGHYLVNRLTEIQEEINKIEKELNGRENEI